MTTPSTAECVDWLRRGLELQLFEDGFAKDLVIAIQAQLLAAQEMAKALEKQNYEVRLLAASHGKLLAVMETDKALTAWREAGGQ